MFDRHHLAHAALAAVYATSAVILTLEGAVAHAICALAAALIYAVLCRRPPDRHTS
jgi:hypothetical protein